VVLTATVSVIIFAAMFVWETSGLYSTVLKPMARPLEWHDYIPPEIPEPIPEPPGWHPPAETSGNLLSNPGRHGGLRLWMGATRAEGF